MVDVIGGLPTLDEGYSLYCRVSGADMLQATIAYQWMHNGVFLNESSSTLSFPSLNMSHVGRYSCQISVTSSLLQETITTTSGSHSLNLQSEQ